MTCWHTYVLCTSRLDLSDVGVSTVVLRYITALFMSQIEVSGIPTLSVTTCNSTAKFTPALVAIGDTIVKVQLVGSCAHVYPEGAQIKAVVQQVINVACKG